MPPSLSKLALTWLTHPLRMRSRPARSRALPTSLLLGCLCLAAGTEIVRAEPSLSLDEALFAALADSPDLTIASAFVDRATALRRAAGAGVPSNPELSVAWESDFAFDDEGEETRGVAVSQEFWAPGQRSARKAEADARIAAASTSRAWAQRRLVAETTVAFGRLAAAQRKADVAEELRGMVERIREATEQRAAVGDVSEYERDRVRIESASSLAELERVRIEAAAAREDLGLLMARVLPTTIRVANPPRYLPWESLMSAIGASLDPASGVERGDVTTAREQLKVADATVTVEKRERRPRLKLAAGWESEDLAVGLDDERESLHFALSIAIPLLRRSGEIGAALADRSVAEAELLRTQLSAAAQLRELVSRGRHFSEALAALDGVQEELGTSLEVLEKAHQLGRLGLIETLTERDRLLRARFQREDMAAELLAVEVRLAASVDALNVLGITIPDVTR